MDSGEQSCRNQDNQEIFGQIRSSNDNFSQGNHQDSLYLNFLIQSQDLAISNTQKFLQNIPIDSPNDDNSEFNGDFGPQQLQYDNLLQEKQGALPNQTIDDQIIVLPDPQNPMGPKPNEPYEDSSSSHSHNEALFEKIMKVDLKQRKNPNFTKFLISIFNKQTNRLNDQGYLDKLHFEELERLRVEYQHRGRRNIKMQALYALFGENEPLRVYTKQNRKILRQHLGTSEFKYYVAYNPFAKANNKKQHLLASKVYRLRCMSEKLTGRTQTK